MHYSSAFSLIFLRLLNTIRRKALILRHSANNHAKASVQLFLIFFLALKPPLALRVATHFVMLIALFPYIRFGLFLQFGSLIPNVISAPSLQPPSFYGGLLGGGLAHAVALRASPAWQPPHPQPPTLTFTRFWLDNEMGT